VFAPKVMTIGAEYAHELANAQHVAVRRRPTSFPAGPGHAVFAAGAAGGTKPLHGIGHERPILGPTPVVADAVENFVRRRCEQSSFRTITPTGVLVTLGDAERRPRTQR
jgi:hypothetical protein